MVYVLCRSSRVCHVTQVPFPNACSSMKSNRHVYEVITEETLCKLYLDVEFRLGCNPGVSGVEVLEVFIRYLCYLIGSCFGLSVDRSHVLDLDSRCVCEVVSSTDPTAYTIALEGSENETMCGVCVWRGACVCICDCVGCECKWVAITFLSFKLALLLIFILTYTVIIWTTLTHNMIFRSNVIVTIMKFLVQ